MRRETAIPVACKERSRTPTQYAFVSCHPLDAEAVRDGQHLLGDAAFRRPYALGAHSEDFLVQIESPAQLLARVLRITKSVLRQREPRRRYCPGVRIADQRQDRVIKR